MKITPLLALSLLLAACGPQDAATDRAAVAPATEANLPADAARAQPAWSASAAGIGPITLDTRFSRDAIAGLFPGSAVEAAFLSEEGDQVPIVTVNGPESLVLEIQGRSDGKVGRILAQGGPVIGPRGEKLMDGWKGMGFEAADCVMGADRFSGAALCRRPDLPTLAYVFGAPGELKGDPGETPDAEALAERGFLREFLWQASLSR